MTILPLAVAASLLLGSLEARAESPAFESPYAAWTNGPSSDPGFFPICVWLQSPKNAARFKAAGINTYVGLWRGPTEEQLRDLREAGMKVICDQNKTGLKFKGDPTIIAWMHGDEPDNAQERPNRKGYGPPILPSVIEKDYQRIRENDPSRPVLLNLGQGVAYDNYIGRGVRRGHMEDYPEYIKGSDIVSFDIYPVVSDSKEVAGRLEFVPKGVQRLVDWSGGKKVVWNCIECTHIGEPDLKASPEQVRSEIWMSLIHGSRGLIYFVHQFKPVFREAALLDDPQMLAAVTEINRQIRELAPVLNSSDVSGLVKVDSSNAQVPIDTMIKRQGNDVYIFAVAMRNEGSEGSFSVPGMSGEIQVIGEHRPIKADGGTFKDHFKGYEAHIYRVTAKASR
jgi:hypothetical protein